MKAILAVNSQNIIGVDGELPWMFNPKDMAWFVKHTRGCDVVMGSSTWFSDMPAPLPGRRNWVISTQSINSFPGAEGVFTDPNDFVVSASTPNTWVIGGARTYNSFAPYINQWYITRVQHQLQIQDQHITRFDVDAVTQNCALTHSETVSDLTFEIWSRFRHPTPQTAIRALQSIADITSHFSNSQLKTSWPTLYPNTSLLYLSAVLDMRNRNTSADVALWKLCESMIDQANWQREIEQHGH